MSDTPAYNLPEYEDVLNRVKHRDVWGSMRPQLYGIVDTTGKPPSKLRLQWMFYAGMGDVALGNLRSDNEKIVLDYLIDTGIVVPTHTENYYDSYDIQRYQHFDDVNWAKNSKGEVVIYNLSQNPYYPDIADTVLPTNESYEKAIDRLNHLLHMGSAMEDDPITLKSGEVITPIITGHNNVAYRQRQKGIFPIDLPESKHRRNQPKP